MMVWCDLVAGLMYLRPQESRAWGFYIKWLRSWRRHAFSYAFQGRSNGNRRSENPIENFLKLPNPLWNPLLKNKYHLRRLQNEHLVILRPLLGPRKQHDTTQQQLFGEWGVFGQSEVKTPKRPLELWPLGSLTRRFPPSNGELLRSMFLCWRDWCGCSGSGFWEEFSIEMESGSLHTAEKKM